MLVLAIETSGQIASLALLRGGVCLEERALEGAGRRHAQLLIPEADRLFRDHGLRLRQCEAAAVSVGPGSFTGLRIGVVFAKMLAYATGCELAAVETLHVIAENSPEDVHDVFVVSDAQRGQLYVGGYRRRDDEFVASQSIRIVDAATWCNRRAASDVVGGPGLQRLDAELRGRCRVLEEDLRRPRAAVVARLGQRKLESGRGDSPWSLEPFYLRKSAAEEKREDAGEADT